MGSISAGLHFYIWGYLFVTKKNLCTCFK